MGQQCAKGEGTTGDSDIGKRSKKYKDGSHSRDENSKDKRKHHVCSEEHESQEDEPQSVENEWKTASTSSESGIVGLSHRSVPKPLLIPRKILSPGFREYSSSTFGGEHNAFLGVSSANDLPGGSGRNALFCVGEGRDITFLNYETGHILFRWKNAHSKDINCITRPSQADEGLVFTASRDCSLRGWRVGEASSSVVCEGHSLNVTGVAIHPHGGRIVSGSRDNSVRLWDVPTGECIVSKDVKLNIVHFVRWIPSVNLVAQGGEDLTVKLWDTRSERNSLILKDTLVNFDYHPICSDLQLSSEGGSENILFTGHNGFNGTGSMIIEWDIRQGSQIRHYHGHSMTIRAVHKLRNGPCAGCLVSVGDDDTLRLWRSGSSYESSLNEIEKPLCTVPIPEGRPSGIDETSDGKLLISLRSGCVLVFSPPTLETFGERYRYLGSPFIY